MSKPKKEFLKNQLKSSINLKEARKREKRKQRIDRQKTKEADPGRETREQKKIVVSWKTSVTFSIQLREMDTVGIWA